MGKRVDFSARSVISPDPSLYLDELGVPYSIAKKVTYPEIVNSLNMKKLQALIANRENYPGAVSIY